MSAANPANVPLATDPRWRTAALDPSSESQRRYLDDLLVREDMRPAQLFGKGYKSMEELSKWAANWGIDRLQEIGNERAAREADEWAEQEREQSIKAWIGHYYRARQRG